MQDQHYGRIVDAIETMNRICDDLEEIMRDLKTFDDSCSILATSSIDLRVIALKLRQHILTIKI